MDELQLEEEETCSYDSVTLYDGRTRDSTKLATYCRPDNSTYTSSGSSSLVVFQSDAAVSFGGFSLSWTFVGGGGHCEGGCPTLQNKG